ncbi:hypothetical protein BRADI_4g34662v3 [Brachypodium distachyon]|uniref:Uncharacterized protein n=1 Tax=Brachypodium distachyon TaxID=15368 RepID=A0A0Q3PN97_BRADI|nr:hypothetical protein BRADI_4g34662v3 [Brachypodium distachyon]
MLYDCGHGFLYNFCYGTAGCLFCLTLWIAADGGKVDVLGTWLKRPSAGLTACAMPSQATPVKKRRDSF